MSVATPRGGWFADVPTRDSLWRDMLEVRGYTWLDHADGKLQRAGGGIAVL